MSTLPNKESAVTKPKLNVKRTLMEHLKARRLRETAQKSEDLYKGHLKDYLLTEGEVEDEANGSRWVRFKEGEVTDEQGETIAAIKAERRCPTLFDEEAAMELIEKYDIREKAVVVETIETINEDALLALAFSGDIPDEEVQALYTEGKETFAFKVIRA